MDLSLRLLIPLCLVSCLLNIFFFTNYFDVSIRISIDNQKIRDFESFTFLKNISEPESYNFSENIESDSQSFIENFDEPSTCFIPNHTFSSKELKTLFKFVSYPRCRSPKEDIIKIKNGKERIICKHPEKTLYFSDNRPQRYAGSKAMPIKWEKTSEINPMSEFQIIKCSGTSIHAIVHNRFQETISNKANQKRAELKGTNKNMNVLLLTFDSVSNISFSRNLPESLKFLESLKDNKASYFNSFIFEKSAVPKAMTAANMAQILFGKTEDKLNINSKRSPKGSIIIDPGRDENQDHAIWTFYRKLGYTTMFLHDNVWDYLPKLTGRVIDTDHVFTNIWKYLFRLTKKHNYSESQRCIGAKNFHQISFEYTYQYFSNYEKNNKFAYVHLDAAHESTGNIRTVDFDLVNFLQDLLSLVEARNESLALFIISDHGFKHVNKIQFNYKGFFEAKLAFTSLVLSKDVIKSLNGSEIIKKNTDKLMGRFDINLTLKQLAYFPYDPKIDLQSMKDYNGYKAFSLVTENLPYDRTCREIAVPDINCVCRWFTPVNLNLEHNKIVKNKLIDLLKIYILDNGNNSSECGFLQIYEVKLFESFQLTDEKGGLDVIYNLEIKYKEDYIKIKANYCFEKKIKATNNILKGTKHPYAFFSFDNIERFIQISKVSMKSECLKQICEC